MGGMGQLLELAPPPPDSVGGRIRQARIARGMKQGDLASLIGTSRETLGKWERGRTSPTASELIELGRHTRTDPGYFLSGLADAQEAGPDGSGPTQYAPRDSNPEPADSRHDIVQLDLFRSVPEPLHLFPLAA